MEPLDYLRLLRRRWRLVAAAVLVAGVVAWVTTPSSSDRSQITWEATHVLLRDTSSLTPPAALAQVALFVDSGEVPQRVADRLGGDPDPLDLVGRLEVEPEETSGSIAITASGPTRQEAADLANAFGEETLAYFGESARDLQAQQIEAANDEVSRLQAEIDSIEDDISAAEEAGEGTGVLEAQRDARIRQYALALDQQTQVLDQPPPSAGYVSLDQASPELATPRDGGFETPRSRPVRAALAVLVGLVLGLIAVLVTERLDPRIHTRESALTAFGLPVVGEIPRVEGRARRRGVAVVDEPMSATAEGYRSVRAAILLTEVSQLGGARDDTGSPEPHLVLVTSPTPGDGKTTTVANLAAVFAETGRSVLILSCDFRRPEIHHHFDVPQRPGISEVLTHGTDLERVCRATPVNGVYLAPDGGGLRSLGALAADGHDLIARARELADIVLVDTAPALATGDASELISAVDAVVLVCRSGRTTAEAARRTRSLLERLRTPTVGVVLVGVPANEAAYAGYYTRPGEAPLRPRLPLRRTRMPDEPTPDDPLRSAARPIVNPAAAEPASSPADRSDLPARPLGHSTRAGEPRSST